MGRVHVTPAVLQRNVDTVKQSGGNKAAAARALGIPVSTLKSRLSTKDIAPAVGSAEAHKILELKDTISDLREQLSRVNRETLDEKYIKEKILGLANSEPKVPTWVTGQHKRGKTIGIPMTIWSDWHMGERVFPSQVNGVNQFDMTIARERVRKLVDRTIDLLQNHMVEPNYPGIIVALIGDLVSGGIHDELAATDEYPIMPIVLETLGVLIWALEQLAAKFKHVWLIGLSGNHGRNTKKIWTKHRAFTNFDWIICKLLEVHFIGDDPGHPKDDRFTFQVSDGADARAVVYSHRYAFVHGDRLGKGGDGIIGSIGPIRRGTIRKMARDSQINLEFDTLCHGHFHTYSPGTRIIGNGSLIGYNEYAYTEGFDFELPQQALWVHSPTRGITFQMAVQLEDRDAGMTGKYGSNPVQFGRV